MITILDGNNVFRRLIEYGSDARSILNNHFSPRNTTLVVWDGERGSSRRRKIYPQYKTNRSPLDKDISIQFNTLVRLFTHCNLTQVFHNEFEGDDVIAALARSYAGAGEKVHINSTDADFLQLKAEFPDLITCEAKGKVSPEYTLLYKIWVGDASDKISGIPNFGEKTWEQTDLEQLQRFTEAALIGEPFDIGLPPRIKPTVELIQQLHSIITFFDVPVDELTIIAGRPDYAAADAFLKEFLQ